MLFGLYHGVSYCRPCLDIMGKRWIESSPPSALNWSRLIKMTSITSFIRRFRDYLFELRDASVPELEDYHQMQLHASRSLSEACLTYLIFDQFSSGPATTAEELARLMGDNVLLRYSAKNWGTHVAQALEDAPVDLVWRFIDCEKAGIFPYKSSWLRINFILFPGLQVPCTCLHTLDCQIWQSRS